MVGYVVLVQQREPAAGDFSRKFIATQQGFTYRIKGGVVVTEVSHEAVGTEST